MFARSPAMSRRAHDCEAALQALDHLADPLLSQLRQLDGTDGSEAEPVPAELIAAVRSAGLRGGAAAWFAAEPCHHRLGKFELVERLGAGSYGYVFRAHDVELGRIVAIKIPRAGSLASKEDAERFLREARSAAQLKHPGIVALHETGQADDGTFYLVEEFVQGTTLASRPGRTRPAPVSAGGRAHRRGGRRARLRPRHGVIHRDIKPSNILLDAEGRPHLMDFGLAKREAEETSMTEEGQVLGTPAYMSPEQARGESRTGRRPQRSSTASASSSTSC